MSIRRTLMSLFVVTSLVAGCSGSSTRPSSVTAGQLAGDWNLASIQPTGQPPQATPAGSTYTLSFSDGRLSTRLDCNTCGGASVLSGQTLTAGPVLACTRAACPTTAFGDAYVGLLSGESTVALTGGNLVLSSARGVLRLMR